MDERTQIDWSKVIPGRTWLEVPNKCQCRVVAVEGEDVWVYWQVENNPQGYYSTRTKSSFKHWQIREEWEDVTEECTIYWDCQIKGWIILYQGAWVVDLGEMFKVVDGRINQMKVYKRRSL